MLRRPLAHGEKESSVKIFRSFSFGIAVGKPRLAVGFWARSVGPDLK